MAMKLDLAYQRKKCIEHDKEQDARENLWTEEKIMGTWGKEELSNNRLNKLYSSPNSSI
jgi:hypothetical protein